jgi:hypothetical protein
LSPWPAQSACHRTSAASPARSWSLAYRNGIIVGRWSSGKISVAVGHGASRIALIVSYRPKAFVTGLTNPKQFDEQSGSYKSC